MHTRALLRLPKADIFCRGRLGARITPGATAMRSSTLLAILFSINAAAWAAQEQSGDLHNASLRDWNQASEANRFATASDLVERMLNLHDPIAVRPKARMVQACISRVSANFQQGSQAVADTAIACMAELGMLSR